MEITSSKNPRIKLALSLRDKRDRDREGLFLIEGYRELSRAKDFSIKTLFISRELFLGENEDSLIRELSCAEIIECPKFLFEKISYRDRPDGLLAIAVQKKFLLEDIVFKKEPFLLLAESLEKPGNLGTILRSADGVGVDGVIILDPCTDIYNPNVVRASVGTLFRRPVVVSSSVEALSFLRSKKIRTIAATPSGKVNYSEANLKGPLAIVVGSEQYGLTKFWMEGADEKVSIPMKGIADSLNVASAATILLYEALRQRDFVS